MSCGDCIALLAVAINIVGISISVFTYVRTVKRDQKIITIEEFSKIRNVYPNLSPGASNPVSDEERIRYLREMERFCLGVNKGIYDFNVVKDLSGHLLMKQYNSYLNELLKSRKVGEETWKYCQYETFIKKLKKKLKDTRS